MRTLSSQWTQAVGPDHRIQRPVTSLGSLFRLSARRHHRPGMRMGRSHCRSTCQVADQCHPSASVDSSTGSPPRPRHALLERTGRGAPPGTSTPPPARPPIMILATRVRPGRRPGSDRTRMERPMPGAPVPRENKILNLVGSSSGSAFRIQPESESRKIPRQSQDIQKFYDRLSRSKY